MNRTTVRLLCQGRCRPINSLSVLLCTAVEYIIPNPNNLPMLPNIEATVTSLPEYIEHNETVTTPLIDKLATVTGLPVQDVFIPATRVSAACADLCLSLHEPLIFRAHG